MKIYYLSQGKFDGQFYLDNGEIFGEHREYLGKIECQDAFKKIKSKVNLKRKALFYLVDLKENEVSSCLEKLFRDSNIKIKHVPFEKINSL